MSSDNIPAPIAQVRGEITCSRIFPQAREIIFEAFSDPVRLASWWGPQGFTNTFKEFDFRPGGVWRFTMHGSDGAAYAMDKQFAEIVRPERIVLRHFQKGHDFTLTMTFAVRDAGTEVTWRMRFDDPEEGEKLRAFLGPANEQNLARLAAHLAQSA
jgi:uncharacterized protein YndB with AHSA1/START domain